MRAKTINEIGFERYKDPKIALGLSLNYTVEIYHNGKMEKVDISKSLDITDKKTSGDFIIISSKLTNNRPEVFIAIDKFCEENPEVILYAMWNMPHQYIFTAAFSPTIIIEGNKEYKKCQTFRT